MRILFITSSYPGWPGQGGGYAQLCEEVAEGLCFKDHQIAVFTSRSNGVAAPRDYPIWRCFQLDPDWNSHLPAYVQFYFGRRQREKQALDHLRKSIELFAPDIIFIWHMIGMDRGLFKWLENTSGIPIVYYLADYTAEVEDEYYEYWQKPAEGNLKTLPKKVFAKHAIRNLARDGKPIRLKYDSVICVSNYVRERLVSRRIISEASKVIHNGVNLEIFRPNPEKPCFEKLNCVVLGRLVPEKGISTVVEAIVLLMKSDKAMPVKLTLVGDGPQEYIQSLKKKVAASGLQHVIIFAPSVNRAAVAEKLAEHNVLILASEWDEPLARSMQEAMAMKLLVVGTTMGGSAEMLNPGKTGLAFQAGDAKDLAAQLAYVISNQSLAAEIAECGCGLVRRSFSITSTIDMIELYLSNMISQSTDRLRNDV